MSTHPVGWAPNDFLSAYDAWQSGWGDLPFAAWGRPVPALVQLGVLTHADRRRLAALTTARRRSRVRRLWGADVLGAIGRMLDRTRTDTELATLQSHYLRPLERRLLDAGRITLSRAELLGLLAKAPCDLNGTTVA